ncbi:hypothetical protein FS837_011338 [Tulasnella sp. UAMH 9824]|nr:hypothetical protein FS837_011338 [Tulasnella sp. UAMH 9824]
MAIRPENANVLINDNRRAVLTDFGLYTLLDHCRAEPTFPGLMRWFSPELVANGTKRTTKSDMWAWGGLTLEIMMGKPPFWGLFSVAAVKDAILNGQTPEPRPAPQDWPNGLLELVRKCWSQRPEDRPGVLTCIDILNITLSVTECLRGEELELPGGSFIASDRLQSEPNQTLREAGNHTTKIVKLSPTGALVVMKEIHLQELRSTSSRVKFFKRFAQNIAYLSSLKHENILDVIGYSAANGFQTVSLVTRHMASGNLMSYVGKEVDISSKYELARDFTDGLQYLHNMEPPVTHGNLTPLNVLINENGKAVLGDYGLEAIEGYRASATSLRASIRWSSPEVNIGTSASVKSDIWSWACVVFQLVTGNRPYSYIQAEDQIKAVMLIGQRGHLTPEAYLEPEDKPNILMQLLRRCWEFDFSRRPNVKECADIVNLMLSGDPGGERNLCLPFVGKGP